MRTKIYIAGPYTAPDPAANVARALVAWHALYDAGFAPYCPHLSHYLDRHRPLPYDAWLALDLEWLVACAAVLRLPGRSPGADRECVEAARLGRPVFDAVEMLVAWDGWSRPLAGEGR